jgi:AmmeMemoRadiSam system protein A
VDAYVELAAAAIRAYVKERKKIPPPQPLGDAMKQSAGVFVSIKKHGELRGCIGTILPVTENLAEEIIANAIASSTQDPRFDPVEPEELGELTISVDVLSQPERVHDPASLDAKKYGVIVKAGSRRGLLLPDLEGINTPEEQIAICRRKGGIRPGEAVELFRFTVTRHNR